MTGSSSRQPDASSRERRRTRIVATLGPSCDTREGIRELVDAGLDVARLNFSHGTSESRRRMVSALRHARRETGRDVALLADLSGPKLRLGRLTGDGPVTLEVGTEVTLTSRPVTGDGSMLPVRYRALARDVSPGHAILLADGTAALRVLGISGQDVRCRVTDGGIVGPGAGVNLPQSQVSAGNPTAKDLRDLEEAISLGADVLAQSFVQSAADVRRLKRRIERLGSDLPVVAKIERPQALVALESILAEAEGVMVARGDLGVECRPEDVPVEQKRIVRLANERAIPVITATQMLESMVTEARPTRAEASDVANAILDGSDAVMLSAETATGHHPARVVRMMAAIALRTERAWDYRQALDARRDALADLGDVAEALARAGRHAAEHAGVAAILVHTVSGRAARRMARQRPHVSIVALSPVPSTVRRLQLVHGVEPVRVPAARSAEGILAAGLKRARELGHVASGQLVAVVAGEGPAFAASNLVRLDRVP